MCKQLIFFLIIALSGCTLSGNSFNSRKQLDLPSASTLPCCWQTYEKLDLLYSDRHFSLMAATVVRNNKALIVILDPLGRRLLTITQKDKTITIDKAPEITEAFPAKLLLLGFYLRHLPQAMWQLEDTGWTLLHQNNMKRLIHDNKLYIQVSNDTSLAPPSSAPNTVIWYPEQKLQITVTTLSRELL